MGGQDAELARRLSANACYRRLFAAAFPERGGKIETPQVVDAIAAFERTLISFAAPVDRPGGRDRGHGAGTEHLSHRPPGRVDRG